MGTPVSLTRSTVHQVLPDQSQKEEPKDLIFFLLSRKSRDHHFVPFTVRYSTTVGISSGTPFRLDVSFFTSVVRLFSSLFLVEPPSQKRDKFPTKLNIRTGRDQRSQTHSVIEKEKKRIQKSVYSETILGTQYCNF